MTESREPVALWYKASPKNLLIFVLIWLGPVPPIVVFIRLIHGSAALYLLLVPWTLLGLTMVVRPNWIMRVTQTWQKELEQTGEQLEKRPPPGFP